MLRVVDKQIDSGEIEEVYKTKKERERNKCKCMESMKASN